MTPILTVFCITYNHQAYIRRALDSFLMQRTNFPFQIFISDDASSDDTPAILKQYATQFPDKIKIFLHDKNQGCGGNFVELAKRMNTPYVALCEGDDFWTDPLKLQKQVDFLEKHPDYTLCFHPARVEWEENKYPSSVLGINKHAGKYTLNQLLLNDNFIPTAATVYRWCLQKPGSPAIPPDILPLDWYVHLLHAQQGKVGFLQDVMSVYYRQSSGLWNKAFDSPRWYLNSFIQCLRFYKYAEKQFERDFTVHAALLFEGLLNLCKKSGDFQLLQTICRQDEDLCREMLQKIALLNNRSRLAAYLKYKCSAGYERLQNKRRFLALTTAQELKKLNIF